MSEQIDTSEVRPGRYLRSNGRWYVITSAPFQRQGRGWPEVHAINTNGEELPLTLFDTPTVTGDRPPVFSPSALNRRYREKMHKMDELQRQANRIDRLAQMMSTAQREASARR